MAVIVRELTRSDLVPARPLLKQLGYDVDSDELARRFDHVLASKEHHLAVAEAEGIVVGLVHVFERPALEKPCEAIVQALVVDESHRQRGIGARLMAAAEDWAASRGLESVALSSQVEREDAHAFYARLAYGTVATSHLMRKHLVKDPPASAPQKGDPEMPFSIQKLDHVVVRVADLDRAIAFYCGVLGCKEERRVESIDLVQLRAGQSLIDLVPAGPAPAAGARNMDHFALRIDPFDEASLRRHFESHGIAVGEVATRYGAEGNGPSLYLEDPDGNTVELKGPPDA